MKSFLGSPSTHQAKLEKPPKEYFFLANRLFPRVEFWTNRRVFTLYFYCVIIILVNVANGFDGSMMNGLQALSYWEDYFHTPTGSVLGFFNASMSLGSIVSLPIVPPLIDRFGRKAGISSGSLIVILGVGLQSGALNFGMFVAARFLIGFGMSLATTAGPLLVSEIAHPQDRARICTLLAASYSLGSFIAAGATYGTLQIPSNWAWRLPSLLQCSCSVIVMIFIRFIPDSPRWYIDQDQPEKALQILAYYHGDGNAQDEFIQLEYTEIRTALALEKEAAKSSTWFDLVKTPGNRRRIFLVSALALFGQWSGNGIISYYLHDVLNSIGIVGSNQQLGINFGLAGLGLVENFVIAPFVDLFGRRTIFMVSTVGMMSAFLTWTILSARYALSADPPPGLGRGVVAMIFVYGFFYSFK
jgi:MFS family permease